MENNSISDIESVTLQKIRTIWKMKFTNLFLHNTKFEITPDYLADCVVAQFSTYLLGKSYESKHEMLGDNVLIPRNKIDYLKHIMPEWIKKRFPPRYNLITIAFNTYITYTNICPHIDVDFGERPDVHLNFVSQVDEHE